MGGMSVEVLDSMLADGWLLDRVGEWPDGERYRQWSRVVEGLGTVMEVRKVYREGEGGHDWESEPLGIWPTLLWSGPLLLSGGCYEGSGCGKWGPWYDMADSSHVFLSEFVDHLIDDGEVFSGSGEHAGVYPLLSLGIRDSGNVSCLNGSVMPRHLWNVLGGGSVMSLGRESVTNARGALSLGKRVRGLLAGRKGFQGVCMPCGPVHAGELSLGVWSMVGDLGYRFEVSGLSASGYGLIEPGDISGQGTIEDAMPISNRKRMIDELSVYDDELRVVSPKAYRVDDWVVGDYRGEFVGFVQFRRKDEGEGRVWHSMRFSALGQDYGHYKVVRRLYKAQVLEGVAIGDHASMVNLAWPKVMKYMPPGFEWLSR